MKNTLKTMVQGGLLSIALMLGAQEKTQAQIGTLFGEDIAFKAQLQGGLTIDKKTYKPYEMKFFNNVDTLLMFGTSNVPKFKDQTIGGAGFDARISAGLATPHAELMLFYGPRQKIGLLLGGRTVLEGVELSIKDIIAHPFIRGGCTVAYTKKYNGNMDAILANFQNSPEQVRAIKGLAPSNLLETKFGVDFFVGGGLTFPVGETGELFAERVFAKNLLGGHPNSTSLSIGGAVSFGGGGDNTFGDKKHNTKKRSKDTGKSERKW